MSSLIQAVIRKKWDVVEHLLRRIHLRTIAPQELIFALRQAAKAGVWPLFNLICYLEIDDKPSIIGEALKIALALKHFPNTMLANQALYQSIEAGNSTLVKELMVMEGVNKPSKRGVYEALELAVKANRWPIVDILLGHAPFSLVLILEEATKAKNWNLVQRIINVAWAKPAMKEAIDKASYSALSSGIDLNLSPILALYPENMGNRLGLAEPFTGSYIHYSVFSCRSRFASLNRRREEGALHEPKLNLVMLDEALDKKMISLFNYKETLRYQSIACEWDGHCFSITLFKEDENTHIIYTNRGQKTDERGGACDEAVMVFTLKKGIIAHALLDQLEKTLASKDRRVISEFFAQELITSRKNSELTTTFYKSMQKVGNCSIANTNSTWHFALAAQFLNDNPASTLKDAYLAVKPMYKAMRMRDRVSAFKQLLRFADRSLQVEAVKQFLAKTKKLERPEYVKSLLAALNEDEIKQLRSIPIDEHTNAWSCLLITTLAAQLTQWELIKTVVQKMLFTKYDLFYLLSVFQQAVDASRWDLATLIFNIKSDSLEDITLFKRVINSILDKKIALLAGAASAKVKPSHSGVGLYSSVLEELLTPPSSHDADSVFWV